MIGDRRKKRDRHALTEEGMVACNPRDREAAHRGEMEGIATDIPEQVTCPTCLQWVYRQRRKGRESGEG